MSFTVKVALVGGLVALAGICLLLAAGFTTLLAPLVTVVALVGLIAGGNLLSSPHRRQ